MEHGRSLGLLTKNGCKAMAADQGGYDSSVLARIGKNNLRTLLSAPSTSVAYTREGCSELRILNVCLKARAVQFFAGFLRPRVFSVTSSTAFSSWEMPLDVRPNTRRR